MHIRVLDIPSMSGRVASVNRGNALAVSREVPTRLRGAPSDRWPAHLSQLLGEGCRGHVSRKFAATRLTKGQPRPNVSK